MRKWTALLLLCTFAWPAMAAKTMSNAQIEQLLDNLNGQSDRKVASQLHNLQPMERVSPAMVARWQSKFPGPRARLALMELVDLSAFLNPPLANLPRDPAPDLATQKQVLRKSAQTVGRKMSRLPDFYATRVTTHFQDNPLQINGHWYGVGIAALHRTRAYNRIVTYRNGREVPFEGAGRRKTEPALGLTTSGEFGPVLAQVLSDAFTSGVSFLRWDQGVSRPAMVFGYMVPQNASHFGVELMAGNRPEKLHPAYHGEIEIDPQTGEILRMTAVADMTPPRQAMIEVIYAPVTIAGRSYILPVKGVAFSKFQVPATYTLVFGEPNTRKWAVQTNMNDVAFIHYHQFRATTQILLDSSRLGTSTPPDNAAPAESPQH